MDVKTTENHWTTVNFHYIYCVVAVCLWAPAAEQHEQQAGTVQQNRVCRTELGAGGTTCEHVRGARRRKNKTTIASPHTIFLSSPTVVFRQKAVTKVAALKAHSVAEAATGR